MSVMNLFRGHLRFLGGITLLVLVIVVQFYQPATARQSDPQNDFVLNIGHGNLWHMEWKDGQFVFLVCTEEESERCARDGVPDQFDWYQYDPFTDTLRKLEQSPYLELPFSKKILEELNLCEQPDEIQYVYSSPSGSVVLYEKDVPGRYGNCTAWVTFLEEDISVKLEDHIEESITFNHLNSCCSWPDEPYFRPSVEITWLSDETKFIAQNFQGSGFINLVSFVGGERATLTPLYWSPIWKNFSGGYPNQVRVLAVSPSGRYILFMVVTHGADFALYNREMGENILLDGVGAYYTDAVWLDNANFLALTRHGVVIYNIERMSYEVLLSAEDMDLDVEHRTSKYGHLTEPPVFAPDGQFLFLTYRKLIGQWSYTDTVILSFDLREILADSKWQDD